MPSQDSAWFLRIFLQSEWQNCPNHCCIPGQLFSDTDSYREFQPFSVVPTNLYASHGFSLRRRRLQPCWRSRGRSLNLGFKSFSSHFRQSWLQPAEITYLHALGLPPPKNLSIFLFIVHERLEPRLNYEVLRKLLPRGVDLSDFILHQNWCKFRPDNIQIPTANCNEFYSRLPIKVHTGDTICFLKPLEYNDRRAAIHELGVYKRIETLGLSDRIRVPHLIGVVQDEQESRITRILLNWVQCVIEL